MFMKKENSKSSNESANKKEKYIKNQNNSILHTDNAFDEIGLGKTYSYSLFSTSFNKSNDNFLNNPFLKKEVNAINSKSFNFEEENSESSNGNESLNCDFCQKMIKTKSILQSEFEFASTEDKNSHSEKLNSIRNDNCNCLNLKKPIQNHSESFLPSNFFDDIPNKNFGYLEESISIGIGHNNIRFENKNTNNFFSLDNDNCDIKMKDDSLYFNNSEFENKNKSFNNDVLDILSKKIISKIIVMVIKSTP